MASEVTVWKNCKQTLPWVETVTVEKVVIGFWKITSNHKVLGICRASLFNQKYNVGWFLLIKFVHLLHVLYLLLVETIPARFFD